MKRRYLLDLTLFDEGGAGAAGSAPAGDGTAAETKETGNEPASGEGQPATDTGKETEPDLDAEFEELLKGKYREQYQKRVQDAVKNRFRATENQRANMEKANKLVSTLAVRYGLKEATIDDVLAAAEKDDNLYEDAAAKAGLSPEQFRQLASIQQERDGYRQQLEQQERQQLEAQYQQQLEEQAAACKQLFPGFDFETECRSNETFANCLRSGMDVTAAYKFAHMDEILSGGIKAGITKGEEKTAAAVRSNVSRPVESAAGSSSALAMQKDFASMSDDEFRAYQDRVMKGEF